MRIALGYYWFPGTTGYHLERALQGQGHSVHYVGLPAAGRAGFDSRLPVAEVLAALPEPVDLYLWVDAGGPYFPPGIEDLPLPTACYLIDVHLGQWRRAIPRFFDAVFIAQRDYLDAYRQAAGHGQVYWLPLAAAADLHRQLPLPLAYDVGFVGNQNPAHRRTPRARRLQLLAGRYRTNDFFRFYPPAEVAQVYSRSRLVFNASIAGDVNMRLFEGAACGALVLTDSIANGLETLFDLGREVVTYSHDADLLSKVDYYLAHEPERAAVAAAGQRRTLAEHTYTQRSQQILDVIAAPEFSHRASLRGAPAAERWAARRQVLTGLHMLDALLDGARAAGRNPLERAWDVLPVLARRLLR